MPAEWLRIELDEGLRHGEDNSAWPTLGELQAPSLQRKYLRHICRSCGPGCGEMAPSISRSLSVISPNDEITSTNATMTVETTKPRRRTCPIGK
jgi:hypothetical protein